MKQYLSILRESGEKGYFTLIDSKLSFIAGHPWYKDECQLEYYEFHTASYTIIYFNTEESMIEEACIEQL